MLYETLERLTGSPVVALNRAVAIAKVGAPERALELVDSLDLDRYRYLHSTRAELLRSLGLADEAREAYARALHLATSRCGKEAVARLGCRERGAGSVPGTRAATRAARQGREL